LEKLLWPVDFAVPPFTCLAPLVHKTAIINLHLSGGIGTLLSVKRWYYIVLLVILILAGVYIYMHRQDLGLVSSTSSGADEGVPTDLTATAPHPAHIVWQQVDRTPDGFKVEMPTDVKDIQIPAYNEQGGADQVNMIYSNADAETTFSVAWADNPPVMRVSRRSPQLTLDTARDDALLRTQTSMMSESKNEIAGFPAREFAARNVGGGVMNSRLIFAGSRLYMLIAAFPAASARRDQDVTRFFNSFTVLNK
jgi:hypothetical protein